MDLVIADPGPVNYLVPIGHIEILPALFQKVILPTAVRDELSHPDTPMQQGLALTRTMGLVARGAGHGVIDLADAFDRLKRTNSRYRQEIMNELLREAS